MNKRMQYKNLPDDVTLDDIDPFPRRLKRDEGEAEDEAYDRMVDDKLVSEIKTDMQRDVARWWNNPVRDKGEGNE